MMEENTITVELCSDFLRKSKDLNSKANILTAINIELITDGKVYGDITGDEGRESQEKEQNTKSIIEKIKEKLCEVICSGDGSDSLDKEYSKPEFLKFLSTKVIEVVGLLEAIPEPNAQTIGFILLVSKYIIIDIPEATTYSLSHLRNMCNAHQAGGNG